MVGRSPQVGGIDEHQAGVGESEELVAGSLGPRIDVGREQHGAGGDVDGEGARELGGEQRAVLLSAQYPEAAAQAQGEVGAAVAVEIAGRRDVGDGVDGGEGNDVGLGQQAANVGVSNGEAGAAGGEEIAAAVAVEVGQGQPVGRQGEGAAERLELAARLAAQAIRATAPAGRTGTLGGAIEPARGIAGVVADARAVAVFTDLDHGIATLIVRPGLEAVTGDEPPQQ